MCNRKRLTSPTQRRGPHERRKKGKNPRMRALMTGAQVKRFKRSRLLFIAGVATYRPLWEEWKEAKCGSILRYYRTRFRQILPSYILFMFPTGKLRGTHSQTLVFTNARSFSEYLRSPTLNSSWRTNNRFAQRSITLATHS